MSPPPVEALIAEAETYLSWVENEDMGHSDQQECLDEVWILYSQVIDAAKNTPVSTDKLSDAHYMKGVVAFEHGWIEEAKFDFERSIELEPDGTSGYFHLGAVNLELGEIELAKGNLEMGFESHKKEPAGLDEYVGACLNMARVHAEQDNTINAIEWVNRSQAANSNINHEHLLATRGGIYLKLGLVDEAIDDLIDAISSGLSHFNEHEKAKAYFDLSVACSQKFDYGQALGYMIQALEQDPNNPNLLTNYGVLLLENDMETEGINHILRGLILHEEEGSIDDDGKAELYFILSSAYMKQKKFDEAEEALETVLKLIPDYPSLHYQYAKLHLGRGDEDAAIESLKKEYLLLEGVIFDDNAQSALLSNLAIVYQDIDRSDKMNELYSKALGLDPENAQALAGRGILNEEQGNFRQAEGDIISALKCDKDMAYAVFTGGRVHHALGVAKWKNGKLDEAEAEIKKALEFEGDDEVPEEYMPFIYNDLGFIRFENKDYRGAGDVFVDSLEFGSTIRAYRGLGQSYAVLGELVDAEEAFREGLELFDEFPEEYTSSPAAKQEWLDVIEIETHLGALDLSTTTWHRTIALMRGYVTLTDIAGLDSEQLN